MKNTLSVIALIFALSSLSIPLTDNVEAKQQGYKAVVQKFITDFRWLDFLKICPEKRCTEKNTEWLRLWYEDDWLWATRSNDSQDYLNNCILYKVEKKDMQKVKSSILPKSIFEKWGIGKNTSFLSLKKVYSLSNNPASYLSDFDYIAKHPRYIRMVVNDVMMNSWEVDILQKKWTSDLYLLKCDVYALPDMMTNFQGE